MTLYIMSNRCSECARELFPAWHHIGTRRVCSKHWTDAPAPTREMVLEAIARRHTPLFTSLQVIRLRARYLKELARKKAAPAVETVAEYLSRGGKITDCDVRERTTRRTVWTRGQMRELAALDTPFQVEMF